MIIVICLFLWKTQKLPLDNGVTLMVSCCQLKAFRFQVATMSTNYKRIAIEIDLIDKITALARKETHISDLAEGRCVEWLFGEYKHIAETSKPAPAQTGKAAKVATPA